MAIVKELIRNEADGSISFGDYSLSEKTKLEDFPHGDDKLKVKTFNEITRLEKNGLFIYESVPGTAVTGLCEVNGGLSFTVEGNKDAEITVGLAQETEYNVKVGETNVGKMKTNLGGKLSFGVELEGNGEVKVEITE